MTQASSSPVVPAMPEPTSTETVLLRFPQWAMAETRSGYPGLRVAREHLLDFAQALRRELGYEYLNSITAVDYFPEPQMEAVYHVSRLTGGAPLVFRVIVPRDDANIPSLTPYFAGANFQEREAWDLLGIRFTHHPDLRRILTWEGFGGHPLRKDWQEAYFEEETKPFKSRWPNGKVVRVEDANPFGDNIAFVDKNVPEGFDPETWIYEGDEALYASMRRSAAGNLADKDLQTEQMILNLGPQHPSTHGVFRMVALLDGEAVADLRPVFGYLHRNHEKIGERNTYLGNMPFTDRLDYISSMSNNFGYALAVEQLTQVKPPERAEYLRVIMAEFTRIVSHLISIGFLLNDLGAFFTPVLYAFEERELILDIFEAVSGSRMMCNYFRFGGVAHDLPEGVYEQMFALVNDRLPRKMDELEQYLTNNEIVQIRTQNVGVLTADQAVANSAAGPILRASGINYDLRRADPYSIYDRFEFDIPVGEHGDVYDRYLVRFDEIRQSIRILKQALQALPAGPIQTGKSVYQIKVPAGESYGRVEGPKGELGFYLVSNGKPNPWRYHVRAPSFINLTSLADMCRGGKIADVVVVLGSIDIVLGEVDR